MRLNWWLASLSIGEILGLATILCIMVRRRQVARWPFFFWSMALELLVDVNGLALTGPGRYKYYFYNYWVGTALIALLRVGVIRDILNSFLDRKVTSSNANLCIFVIGLTISVASVANCYHDTKSPTMDLMNTVLMLNRCVWIAWTSFAAVALIAARRLRMRWSAEGAFIAAGIALRFVFSMAFTELIHVNTRNMRFVANGLLSASSLAVFLFWSYCLATSTQFRPAVVELQPQQLATAFAALRRSSRERT